MIDQRNRDDALVAQIRGSIRAEGRKFLSLLIAFLIISALFIGILEFHLPMRSTGLAALGVFLVWIVVMFRIRSPMASAGADYPEDILRRTIDDQHRRWRWLYGFVFILVGGLAAMITAIVLFLAAHAKGRPGAEVSSLVVVMDFAVFAVVAAVQVCFGPGFLSGKWRRALNDELTRAMQRGAAMFGYLLCVATMCALLGVMAVRPQWGLVAMPGAIAAAVILPGLYFLILQWRADRDG